MIKEQNNVLSRYGYSCKMVWIPHLEALMKKCQSLETVGSYISSLVTCRWIPSIVHEGVADIYSRIMPFRNLGCKEKKTRQTDQRQKQTVPPWSTPFSSSNAHNGFVLVPSGRTPSLISFVPSTPSYLRVAENCLQLNPYRINGALR